MEEHRLLIGDVDTCQVGSLNIRTHSSLDTCSFQRVIMLALASVTCQQFHPSLLPIRRSSLEAFSSVSRNIFRMLEPSGLGSRKSLESQRES